VLGSYRYDVSQLVPKATRVAWSMKKNDIMKDQPGVTKRKFLYNLSRSSYRKNWGKTYQRPSFGDEVLAFIIRMLPKIGPLKVFELKAPTPAAQQMFEASFNATLDRYRKLLSDAGTGQLTLPDDNFDTGDMTGPGQYFLNDQAQAQLLDELAKQNFAGASPEVRTELLQFFGQPGAPNAVRRNRKEWARVQAEVERLKSANGD
jgi:cation transport regulator ChaB